MEQGDSTERLPPHGKEKSHMAVIIETQMTTNLVPLLLHFGSVLEACLERRNSTRLRTVRELPASNTFREAVRGGKIEIRFLPPGTVLTSSGSVSRFLTKPWLLGTAAGI